MAKTNRLLVLSIIVFIIINPISSQSSTCPLSTFLPSHSHISFVSQEIHKDEKSECEKGPAEYERYLKFTSLSSYLNDIGNTSTGIQYTTSLFVDDTFHNFGNFLRDGEGCITLVVLSGCICYWITIFIY